MVETRFTEDLRPLLFEDATWFDGLSDDTPGHWVLWRITKSAETAWWREVLIAAAAFARDHDLLREYRRRFAGVDYNALADSHRDGHGSDVLAPLWYIANELITGMYLERALGWTLVAHEPCGYRDCVGDWEFLTPTGRTAFVEVKSIVESSPAGGVFWRGVASDRLTSVLRGAYRQLPRDTRSTMVVVAGNGLITALSHEVMFTDLFQTLFGQMQISFTVMPYVEGSERVHPSFYDTFAHAGKHRRLGCVVGLNIGGLDTPGLVFYAIHNPYADAKCRFTREDFGDALQFWVDPDGTGNEIGAVRAQDRWRQIAARTSHEVG